MAKRKRRSFTTEFKAQAVSIVRESRTLRMERDILKRRRPSSDGARIFPVRRPTSVARHIPST